MDQKRRHYINVRPLRAADIHDHEAFLYGEGKVRMKVIEENEEGLCVEVFFKLPTREGAEYVGESLGFMEQGDFDRTVQHFC